VPPPATQPRVASFTQDCRKAGRPGGTQGNELSASGLADGFIRPEPLTKFLDREGRLRCRGAEARCRS
jgi:hypothetical protein